MKLDYRTIQSIKDCNPFNELKDLSAYSGNDMQFVLVVMAYTTYLKQLKLLPEEFQIEVI